MVATKKKSDYTDVKDFLEKIETRVEEFNFKDNKPLLIEKTTQIKNEENEIKVAITKTDDGLTFNFNTFTAGIVLLDDFFDLMEYVVNSPHIFKSEKESWLTEECMEKLCDLKNCIKSNRIVLGMQKSEKPIGRPTDSEKIKLAVKMYKSGNYTGQQIAKIVGISRSTLYRYLNKEGV